MRALALFSGGLDSMLAIKLLSDSGVDVVALHMNTGFGARTDEQETLTRRAKLAGATLQNIDIRDEFLKDILFDPKYGYGKHFNPCIDCHGFMFKVALALLPKYDAKFLITGEVLGQRPMSQRKDALKSVKKLAGDEEDLILRPLSAKLIEPTKPIKEGWVDENVLLDISGRGRERQLAMAADLGWEDYASPGGGCLLTDPLFATKMKEFLSHEPLHVEDIDILKNGRHLRLENGAKLIIGRNQEENEFLKNAWQKEARHKYETVTIKGVAAPFVLLAKNANAQDKALALKVALTFTKASPEQKYSVQLGDKTYDISPFDKREDAHKYLIIK